MSWEELGGWSRPGSCLLYLLLLPPTHVDLRRLQLPSCPAPTLASPLPEWSGSLPRVTSPASFAITTRSQVSPSPGRPVPRAFPPPALLPQCHRHSFPSSPIPPVLVPLPAAPFEDRVTFSNTGITFHSVTRKDTGMYTCMVSDEGGTAYGEVSVHLIVLGMCQSSVPTGHRCFPQCWVGSAEPGSSLMVQVLWAGTRSQ